jgi:hypothetical protein
MEQSSMATREEVELTAAFLRKSGSSEDEVTTVLSLMGLIRAVPKTEYLLLPSGELWK